MRRPLHITSEYPPYLFGGLGTAVAGLVDAARAAGNRADVLVVAGSGSGPYRGATAGGPRPPREAPAGVRFFSFAAAIEAGPSLVRRLRTDVLHLHSPWLWDIAAAIRCATDVPIVYTAHSIDRAEVEAGEWLPHGSIQDDVLLGADRVIALSQSELGRLRAYYPDIRNRVHVVGNGICEPPRLPRRPPKDTVDILYVGRFANRKGMVDLFEALAIVARASPAARFLFVGGGDPRSTAGEAARWLPPGLCDRVGRRAVFYGWLEAAAVAELYRAADVLVVPSRYEPFGMVVLEGMSQGLAVVVTDTGGPAEIVDHGVTGLVVAPRRPADLAAALLDLCGDEELRLRLGRAARRVVAERYSWGQVVCALEAVYDASCAS